MKTNVGGLDRVVRIASGSTLMCLAVLGAAQPWAWIGVAPLASGLLAFCPIYNVTGKTTDPGHDQY